MSRGLIVVEGVGEMKAATALVARLWNDLDLEPMSWTPARRWPKLHRQEEVARACEWARGQRDVGALLVLRDEDDACPKHVGPTVSAWLSNAQLPFPAAFTLFHREYEVLFLASLPTIRGRELVDERNVRRPGVVNNAECSRELESIRGVKEWLSSNFSPGRSYKPSLDQLPMTRLIDFDVVRASGLPCFGTLERALRFLDARRDSGSVYPPPV